MESSKKYEYLLEQPEIREFCFYAFLEQLKCSKKDRIHYELIAKESFPDKDQISAMHELCARKGVKLIQGRKMQYLPDWGFVLLVVLYVILCVGIIFMSAFWSSMNENRGQRHRAAQEQREMYYQEDVY